ncbi:major facilitator superfamily domain-containing protein [Xylaria sp. FL0933]|nr:major facilitator superfamily domain-containing protein [Xylaria sp. FL0933]
MASSVTPDEKLESQHYEDYVEPHTSISEAHRQYTLERHGTDQLDPFPDFNDADPYNWPRPKKWLNLAFVAFHGFMATFTAAAIQSAFEDISIDLHVSLQQVSYLVSLVIAILGVSPIFWRPLADRFGRRPVLLASLVISLAGNVGCAKSPTYSTMAVCRAITAFGISPAAGIGSGMVQEMFFKHQRGRYIGIWTVLVTLGVPVAPFIFGFVALRVGYRWIYWTLAITNAIQLISYFFLGSETRYLRGQENKAPGNYIQRLVRFRRIDPTPITIWDYTHPFRVGALPCVTIPAIAHAMIFNLASVFPTFEIPQLYVENFHQNTQEVGLQSVAVILGTLLGEQVGGHLSDRWMRLKRAKTTEFRLWLSYFGYALTIAGNAVFLIQLEKAGNTWNVTPTVGAGVVSAGNQIVTTVLITYAVDCHHQEATSIGVFIICARQIWGFIGPFWFPPLLANVGFKGTVGVLTAIVIGAAWLPTMLLQWRGGNWHKVADE